MWIRFCTVSNSTANYNGKNGVWGDHSSIVKNCTFTGNNQYGIDLNTDGHIYVLENFISGNSTGQMNNCAQGNNCKDNATW